MAEAVSRGGFHVQHLQHGDAQAGKPPSANTRGDRSRLLKEAMRALEEADAARQAARNPSIVAADTHLNRAYVNDGNGGLRELTPEEGVEPVLEYGDARIDAVKRKWHPQAFETTTMIAWVPKSLLREIPDYYPVHKYDKTLKRNVEIGRRSRWVMPEDAAGKAEVDRWFRTTHGFLTGEVLTGGHDAVHGVVWNFDESAVHVHWMCDTMAPLVKDLTFDAERRVVDDAGSPVIKYRKPLTLDKVVKLTEDDRVAHAPEIAASSIRGIDRHGRLVGDDGVLRGADGRPVRASTALRVEAQQMWGQSDEVTERRVVDGVERDVKITGATKSSRYQTRYREHLIEQGFDIELEVNPQGTSLNKVAFGASEADRLEIEQAAVAVAERERDLDAAVAVTNAALDQREAAIAADAQRRQAWVAAEMARLDQREAGLAEREAEIPGMRAAAVEEGRAEGREVGRAEVKEELGAAERARIAATDHERRQREAADEAEAARATAAEDRVAVAAERQAIGEALDRVDDLVQQAEKWADYDHTAATEAIPDPHMRAALAMIPAYEQTPAGYTRGPDGQPVQSTALEVAGALAPALAERERQAAARVRESARDVRAELERRANGGSLDDARRRIEDGEGIMAQQDRERRDRGPDLSEGMDR